MSEFLAEYSEGAMTEGLRRIVGSGWAMVKWQKLEWEW